MFNKKSYAFFSLALIFLLTTNQLFSLSSSQATQSACEQPKTFINNMTLEGTFLCYWETNGGQAIFGFPITNKTLYTDPFTGVKQEVQWFERHRFYLIPGTPPLVGLAPLGKEYRREAADKEVDPDFQPTEKIFDKDFAENSQKYFEETGQNLRGRFFDYWNENGGETRFGKPISSERLEYDVVSKTYFVAQWFELARFEYHPENLPPNDVLLGLLGSWSQSSTTYSDIELIWKKGPRTASLGMPNSIFIDGNQNIYINDRNTGRVNKYIFENGKFNLVNYWYLEKGSQAIAGVSRDSLQNTETKDKPILYSVPPFKANVVRRLMPKTGKWDELSLKNSGDPDMLLPNQALAVDSQENIYILKAAYGVSHLVWKYDAQGNFLGKYVKREEVANPTALAIDNDKIYLSEGAAPKYRVFSIESSGKTATLVNTIDFTPENNLVLANGTLSKNSPALSIALNKQGQVFLGLSGKILRFENNRYAGDLGTYGTQDTQLLEPLAIAADLKNNLYIADPANQRVSVYSSDGQYIGKIEDNRANRNGVFKAAAGLAITGGSNTQIFVADSVSNRIQVFDSTGHYKQSWVAPKISQIAISPQNELYGLNIPDGKITRYDLNGKELGSWGKNGTQNGEFRQPSALAIDKNGNIYVADTANQRIQKFDSSGKFLKTWGGKGSAPEQFGGNGLNDTFNGPNSIAIEASQQIIYIVDQFQKKVFKYDLEGKLLGVIQELPSDSRTTSSKEDFMPLMVAALPPSGEQNNLQGSFITNEGIYLLTQKGLYRLDKNDQRLSSYELIQSVPLGDSGDGGIAGLTSIAASSSGAIFTTDVFKRLQKFNLKKF